MGTFIYLNRFHFTGVEVRQKCLASFFYSAYATYLVIPSKKALEDNRRDSAERSLAYSIILQILANQDSFSTGCPITSTDSFYRVLDPSPNISKL